MKHSATVARAQTAGRAVSAALLVATAVSPSLAGEYGASVGGELPTNVGQLLADGPHQPIPGTQVGPFVLLSTLNTAIVYDDNVLATKTDKTTDLASANSTDVTLLSRWSEHSFRLNVGGDGIYHGKSSETQGNAHIGADVGIDLSANSRVSAFARFALGHEERGTGESFVSYREPIATETSEGGLTLRTGSEIGWTEIGGKVRRLEFANPLLQNRNAVDQSFRSGDVFGVFARAGRDVSASMAAFVEGAYDKRDYGSRTFDSDGYRLLAGLSYRISEVMRGEVAGGYLGQRFEPGHKDLDTYTYRSQIVWQPGPEWTVAMISNREVGEPSMYAGATNTLVSTSGARADYAISEKLAVHAAAGLEVVNYIDLKGNDQLIRLQGGADYAIGPQASVWLKYTHWTHISGVGSSYDYDRNVISAGVRSTY